MKTVQVNIKLTEEEAAAIDKFIENGDFDTRTEFIRYALRKIIKTYDGKRITIAIESTTENAASGGGADV